MEENYRELAHSMKIKIGTRLPTTMESTTIHQCSRLDWCNLICLTDVNSVFMAEYLVSPFYKNKTQGLVCYTKLQKDMAFNATITHSGETSETKERTWDKLVNGFFNGDHDECSMYNSASGVWMLIDLGTVRRISKIQITVAGGGWSEGLPQFLEIKVGKDMPETAGDFSSYKFFGILQNPNLGETIDINANPVIGRFVALSEKSIRLFLCLLQIF